MKEKNVRPWDLLNKNNLTSDNIAKERLQICMSCPELLKRTIQCKKCGCFMELKTKLKDASCPVNKWSVVNE